MEIYQITEEVINSANNIQSTKFIACVVIDNITDKERLFNNSHLLAKSENLKYILAGSSYKVRIIVKELEVMDINSFKQFTDYANIANVAKANARIKELNRALTITNKKLCRHNNDQQEFINDKDYLFVDKYQMQFDEHDNQWYIY